MTTQQFSKNALIFILITIAIDSIGLGIIIPSLPSLVADATGMTVQESSKYGGLVMATYALTQFLFAPLIGNLSDRFGRKPIILLSLFGLGIDYVFMFYAPSLAWLVVGRAIGGMFGASFTTAAAYIADISTDENRARNFGMIGAAFGIGFIVGPAIGAAVSGFGIRAPFLVASFFTLANLIYGLLFLKESLPADHRRAFDLKRANPIGALIQIQRFARNKYLFLVTFLVLIANAAVHSLWSYYTMSRYSWGPKDVGISLAIVGVSIGLIQGGFSGVIFKKLGERKTTVVGLIILIITITGIGLLPYGWMMYVIILPYALSGISDAGIRSIVSGQTARNEQGELQGIFTSLMSVAEVIGPLFMFWVFYKTTPLAKENPIWYGSPFFVGGVIALVALVILRWVFSHVKKPLEDELIDDVETAETSLLTETGQDKQL
jgi:MFS transporter, DHA1 family, tetracycline resistance protein